MNPQPTSGGPIMGGQALSGTPATPKMTDEQLRLECVRQVIVAKVDPRHLTASADRLYQYIKTGTPNPAGSGMGVGA